MIELLYGAGYDQAELMIVADYARKHDAATGACLSGYYAKKLDNYLKDANYSLDKCYRTCIVKQYVTGLGVDSWSGDKILLKQHLEEYLISEAYYVNLLIEELKMIKPTVIIAMGEYAMRILTGKEGVSRWRGSVVPLDALLAQKAELINCRVVVTEHVFKEINQEEIKYLIKMDIQKAVDLIFKPDKAVNCHEVKVIRNFQDYLNFRGRYPDSPKEMNTDIETRFGFITCASVCFDGYAAATIPMIGSELDRMDKCRLMYSLALDLQNPQVGKINQNIGYDKRIYQRFGFLVEPVTWDTMLAAHTIAPEYPKRLDFLTSLYTDMSYYKDEGREFDPSRHSYDRLYEYCAKDSISGFQIKQGQEKDLKEMEAYDFFINFVMPLFDFYYSMDSIGFPVDIAKRDELIVKYESLYQLKYLELKAIVGYDINLNSPSQIGKYMEVNRFPILRHRVPSGYMVPNTDVESIRKMKVMDPSEYRSCAIPYEHAIRFLDLTLLLRRIDKVLEYINVGIHPWGRVHTSVKLGGTSSGRTSNSQTSDQVFTWVHEVKQLKAGPKETTYLKLKNLGGSFQTVTKHGFIIEGEEDDDIEEGIIGKDVREMYLPDDGFVLVEIDRSQAEARVVDLICEDYEALEEYGKIDKHSKTASYIFNQYTYEDIFRLAKIEKTDEGEYMRQVGKKGAHAANYDMGDYRLSFMANIDRKFAKEVLQKIHRNRPLIRQVFHTQVEEIVRSTRTMANPYGRIRRFFKKLDSHGIKVAYSWFPQSTISDGTKWAGKRIMDQVDNLKAYIVAENHDSLTAMVKMGYLRKYVMLAKKELEAPIDFRQGSFPRDYQLVIPVEVGIGRKNWGNIKTLKLKKVRLAA